MQDCSNSVSCLQSNKFLELDGSEQKPDSKILAHLPSYQEFIKRVDTHLA